MNDVKRKQTNNINYTARPSKLRLRRSLSNEGKNIFNNIVHQAPPLVQQQQYMYAIPFSPAPASNQVDNGQYYDNDESRRNSFVLSTPSTPIDTWTLVSNRCPLTPHRHSSTPSTLTFDTFWVARRAFRV